MSATISQVEDYSGHADGAEREQWLKEDMPIGKDVVLTHGEEGPQVALEEDISGLIVKGDCIYRPQLDDVYALDGEACALLESESKPRIDPADVARPDWNNDLTGLHFDIDQEISKAAEEKSSAVIIRRLTRPPDGSSHATPRRRPPTSATPGGGPLAP